LGVNEHRLFESFLGSIGITLSTRYIEFVGKIVYYIMVYFGYRFPFKPKFRKRRR